MGQRPGLAVKRASDLAAAAAAGVLLLPVLAGAALTVRMGVGSPVLFRQPRPGRDGKVFTLYKLRTMTDRTASDGTLLPDAERLTPVGNALRRWSIDELPELWNVIKGDMSLVGPRPLLVEYLDLYDDEQLRRHEMRPGLTGLAQISGRNDQTWEERLALDVWYIDHWSLWLDAKIIAKTVVRVLAGDGVANPEHATMGRFEGSQHA